MALGWLGVTGLANCVQDMDLLGSLVSNARGWQMRILIVHFNIHYMNPTAELWPLMFKAIGETEFYGPGFQPDEVLEEGLARYLERRGSFDCIVLSEHAANVDPSVDTESWAANYERNYYIKFDARRALERKEAVLRDARECGLPMVVVLLETDYYCLSENFASLLWELDPYLVGWGAQFIKPVSELPNLAAEGFGHRANDRWWGIVTNRPHRVVSIPAFVAESEFAWEPIAARSRRWSVLGSGYAARKEARSALEKERLRWSGRGLYYGLAGLERLWRGSMGNRVVVSMANAGFRRALSDSMASYTCGSGLEYPVRKFFEIPAHGCLLVCRPCSGFEALGFRDGVNAVVAEPGDVIDVDERWLTQRMDASARVAASGRELVWEQHSLHSRGRQLRLALEAILGGRFNGGEWMEGRFELA